MQRFPASKVDLICSEYNPFAFALQGSCLSAPLILSVCVHPALKECGSQQDKDSGNCRDDDER